MFCQFNTNACIYQHKYRELSVALCERNQINVGIMCLSIEVEVHKKMKEAEFNVKCLNTI